MNLNIWREFFLWSVLTESEQRPNFLYIWFKAIYMKILNSLFGLPFNSIFSIAGQLEFPNLINKIFWKVFKIANHSHARMQGPLSSFDMVSRRNKNILLGSKVCVNDATKIRRKTKLGKHVFSIIMLRKAFMSFQ